MGSTVLFWNSLPSSVYTRTGTAELRKALPERRRRRLWSLVGHGHGGTFFAENVDAHQGVAVPAAEALAELRQIAFELLAGGGRDVAALALTPHGLLPHLLALEEPLDILAVHLHGLVGLPESQGSRLPLVVQSPCLSQGLFDAPEARPRIIINLAQQRLHDYRDALFTVQPCAVGSGVEKRLLLRLGARAEAVRRPELLRLVEGGSQKIL
jgi:hypothetical protein